MSELTRIGTFEKIRAEEWLTRHRQKKLDKGNHEAHSLKEFRVHSRSGIGTTVYVVCFCGKKKDVSDYGSW